ncbi:caveolin-3-like [Mya arenaria]|nr:caveolin-3-like [Mya arenaria]
MASIPPRKGLLAFKKTSFDAFSPSDPTDTSLPVMTPPKPNGKDVKEKKKRRISSELRDPENVNDIVKIEFNDIFAEPEGTYSFGTIWGASNNLFTDTKVWCYKFLSALLAVPCSICWGVNFACLSFCQIWLCEPGIRCGTIHCRPWSRIFGLLVRSFVEPTFAAVGKIFGNIRVTTSKE